MFRGRREEHAGGHEEPCVVEDEDAGTLEALRGRAVEKFLLDYGGFIVRLAIKASTDGYEAEDAAQDLRLKVCEAGRKMDPRISTTAYLYQAVRRRATSLRRSGRNRPKTSSYDDIILSEGKQGTDEISIYDAITRTDWRASLSSREYAVAMAMTEGVNIAEVVRSGWLTRGQAQYVVSQLRKKLGTNGGAFA